MGKSTLIILVVGILFSCGSNSTEELFDTITTITYNNQYDKDNRLVKVETTEQEELNVNGEYVLADIRNGQHVYEYYDDDTCKTYTNDITSGLYFIDKYGVYSYEHIIIDEGDTTYFNQKIFINKEKQKLSYERLRLNKRFLIDKTKFRINTESNYYYDQAGNNNKIIERDFNSGQVLETYLFVNLSFNDVFKQLPKSKNKQRVVNSIETMNGDTTIIVSYINDTLSVISKKYQKGDKQIEETLDQHNRPTRIVTRYRENNTDIKIEEIMELGLVDSTYSINEKIVRESENYSDSKTITTLEYDQYGNKIKEIKKSKSDTKISDEDWNGIIQRYGGRG